MVKTQLEIFRDALRLEEENLKSCSSDVSNGILDCVENFLKDLKTDRKVLKGASKYLSEFESLSKSVQDTQNKYYDNFQRYEEKKLEKQVFDTTSFFIINQKKAPNYKSIIYKLKDKLINSHNDYKSSVNTYNQNVPNLMKKIVNFSLFYFFREMMLTMFAKLF